MKPTKLLDGVLAIGHGIFLTKHNVLILSDLHIGYEEELIKRGMLIPKFHFKELVRSVEQILDSLSGKKIEKIIINGDLKHEFGNISDEEWRNTLKMLDFLQKKCETIILVQGNHDSILGPIADKRNILLVKSIVLEDFLITHGDKEEGLPDGIKTIIIGHEHPAVTLYESGRKEQFKCFLVGKYKRKNLIVMPSLNPVTEGTDVRKDKLLSPYLKGDLGNYQVFILGDEVYPFGLLRQLPR